MRTHWFPHASTSAPISILVGALTFVQIRASQAIAAAGQTAVAARSTITLPDPLPFPSVAATPAELARLRAAWQSTGPAHQAVARRVSEAESVLGRKVLFPPEGGHHN